MTAEGRTETLPIATARQTRRAVTRLARPYRARIAGAAVVLVAGTATLLLAPLLLGEIIDRVIAGQAASAITAPVLGLIVVAVVAALLDTLGRALVAGIGEQILATLREDVVRTALAASPDRIERAGSGDLVSRVSGDVEAVSELVGEALPSLARSGLMIGLTFVGLGVLDWRLALAGLAAVPVQAYALRRYLRVASPMYASERAAEAVRTQQLLGSIEGAPTVRAYRLFPLHLQRVTQRCREALTISLGTTVESTRFFGRLNIGELIGTSSVLLVGFLLVRADAITVGAATAAALYFIRLFDPFNTLLALVDDAQEATAALARLVGVTQLPARIPAGRPAQPADAAVVLDGVGHSYLLGHPVLADVDLALRPGERVALVGATGAGKTTLARLVAGATPPTTGRIRIGGVDVGDLDRTAPRRSVVLISQEVHTFAGTLAGDLRLARPDATDDELVSALEAVGATTWLRALPDGLSTVVGAGGHRLTTTQAQQTRARPPRPRRPPGRHPGRGHRRSGQRRGPGARDGGSPRIGRPHRPRRRPPAHPGRDGRPGHRPRRGPDRRIRPARRPDPQRGTLCAIVGSLVSSAGSASRTPLSRTVPQSPP
ncbi:MAG: ABC transporter ATP-binding protein [Pseudonocardiaceae bacterium]